MDVFMPVLTGIEATQILHSEMPQVRVIGLSMHNEPEISSAMRDAGAVGYLSKTDPPDELIDAIRACAPALNNH
jgi:DNA-binding NarL/FixJ family response regulator